MTLWQFVNIKMGLGKSIGKIVEHWLQTRQRMRKKRGDIVLLSEIVANSIWNQDFAQCISLCMVGRLVHDAGSSPTIPV
jgi:hypothetical protein